MNILGNLTHLLLRSKCAFFVKCSNNSFEGVKGMIKLLSCNPTDPIFNHWQLYIHDKKCDLKKSILHTDNRDWTQILAWILGAKYADAHTKGVLLFSRIFNLRVFSSN